VDDITSEQDILAHYHQEHRTVRGNKFRGEVLLMLSDKTLVSDRISSDGAYNELLHLWQVL
jgi:hypothetical protein